MQLKQYESQSKLKTCHIDTDGHEYYGIEPSDNLFVKYNFNIFSNKDFCNYLEERGIDTLIFTGVDTMYCVETAVRNAYDLGYKVIVPQDLIACNAKYPDIHANTLTHIQKVFGTLTSSEDFLENLKSS